MTQERDCNSCRHHVQAASLDDCPAKCWSCSKVSFLPQWEPKEAASGERITDETTACPQPLDTQVGGRHYKGFAIQPIEFCMVNGLNACQSKVIKYVCRQKGDRAKQIEDLEKAIHVIGIYKQMLEAGKV